MMKIAISGAHCSGKSTLLNFMKKDKDFKKFEFKESFSTKLAKENKNHSENTTLSLQLKMLYYAYNQLIETCNIENVVYDRCILDVLCYTLMKKEIKINLFNDVFEDTLGCYNHIFICGIESIKIEDDNKRSLDLEFREKIANLFKKFTPIEMFMNNIHYLPGNLSPEERIKIIKYHVL